MIETARASAKNRILSLLQPIGLLLLNLARYQSFPERVIHQYFGNKRLFLFCGRNNFGAYGKGQGESDALTFLVLDVNFSTMVIDDKVTGHQINAKFVVVADAQGKRDRRRNVGLL